MEQKPLYVTGGKYTPELPAHYLENMNSLPDNNNIDRAGYRNWFVRLVDINRKTIIETELDVKPIELAHLVDTGISDMIGQDNRPVRGAYVKDRLYNSILNIFDIWLMQLRIYDDVHGLFINSVDTPTQENGVCGEVSVNLMYDGGKSHEVNLQTYQIILDKANKLFELISKVKVYLNPPATPDGIVLRYRKPSCVYRNDYMPIPVYFYFKDMDGTLASMLPDYYKLLDGEPYRVYDANIHTFDHVVLDVLNFINYHTYGKLLFNPKEM